MLLNRKASRLIRSARLAHLATADAKHQPHVVPICFVFDGKGFYSAIDEKPKRTVAAKLKRLSNIRENPRVSLVIDRYHENWAKLAYILIFGHARILLRGEKHRHAVHLLRKKYPQYRSMAIDRLPIIAITPDRVLCWGNL